MDEQVGWSVVDVETFASVSEPPDNEQNLEGPTAFSRVGAPTRFAEDDGRIAAASATDAVNDWLDDGDSYADDDGTLIATAYHFASGDDAEDSVDALRELYESGMSVQTQQPFSDFLEVDDVEADGATVVVTSRPADATAISFPYWALMNRDLLYVSR